MENSHEMLDFFFVYLFFGIGGSKGMYVNFFSLTVNAAIVGVLIPMIIKFVFFIFSINVGLFSNITVFFPSLHPESWRYVILSQIDIFYLWFVVIIALGVSVYSKMKKNKAIFISLLFFLFRSTVMVLI